MIDLGFVKPGSTISVPFASYTGSNGASSAVSNYAAADILVYKDRSTTERASTSGYTATISFDSVTGLNLAIIDLADNTTAGFWAAGSEYFVVLSPITIDSQTVVVCLARFVIGVDGAVLNTTIATLSSQTSFTLTVGPAEDDALNGCVVYIHDVASAAQGGFAVVNDYTGSTKTVTLTAGTTFTAAATDNISIFPPSNTRWINTAAAATPGATGGILIAGSNAATTFAGLTTGALACTTITASGAVAFQSTFAVTTSTSLAALSCTTLTASGAVAFQSTFAVTTSTALGAISGSTLTLSGAVAFQSTFVVTGATTFTGAITGTNASNDLRVNTVALSGTTQTGRDIGASVLLSNGTGTGQLKLASGYVAMTLADVAATTTTVNFSGMTIKTATDVEADTANIQSRIPAALTVDGNIMSDALRWNGLATVALPLAPTTAGRALDVTAAGNAGIDWGNVENPTTTLVLSGTTIAVATAITGTVTLADASLTTAKLGTFVLAKNTNITGFNDIAAADVWAVGTRTITGGTVGTITGLTISGLENMQTRWAGMTVLDGAVYQYTANALELGPGGGAGIAQAVWDLATSGIVTVGSIGEFVLGLNAGAGTGAFIVTVTVTDGTDPLQNANVRLIEGVTPYTATTNASGVATFSLDAATYSIAITKPGYQFTPGTIVVTAAGNFAKVMTEVVVAPPADPTLCRVYAYLQTKSGVPVVGATMKAKLNTPAKADAMITHAEIESAGSDADGLVYLDLIITTEITPAALEYEITIAAANFTRQLVTPTGATYDLGVLIT